MLQTFHRRTRGILEWARDYHRQTERGALLLDAVVLSSVVLTFAFFLIGSQWTVLPFLAFAAAVLVGWIRYQSETAKVLTLLMTIATVAVLGLIVGFLLLRSMPAFERMGLNMFTRTEQPLWQTAPDGGTYSLLPMMVGTALTTILATIVAAPLGIAGAIFISELAPDRLREIVKPGIELMAGIPSIVYGFVGFFIINDYFYNQFQTPTLGTYFAVGLVIGLMAVPTIVTVAEDAIAAVPDAIKDGSIAVGSTQWQTTKSVTLPAAVSGISAAILLGVGRAMGETMAATVMLTHTKGFPGPIFDVFSTYGETLTTVIAFEGANSGGTHRSALFAAGVVLFVMVMALSITSQWIEWRMHEKLGGEV